MPTLPAVIVTLLLPFEHLFDPRTMAQSPTILAMGAILSSRQTHRVLRPQHPAGLGSTATSPSITTYSTAPDGRRCN